MKKLLTLLIIIIGISCAAPTAAVKTAVPWTEEDVIAEDISRTVAIRVKCGVLTGWGGSGVILGNDRWGNTLIGTAAHVIEFDTFQEADCSLYVGDHKATVLSFDSKDDLALIVIRESVIYDSVCYAEGELGMQVFAVGYSWEFLSRKQELSVTEGRLVTKFKSLYRYRISASFFGGSSGGGVWDSSGCLIGLSVSGWQFAGIPVDDQYYVAPVKTLTKMHIWHY